MPEGLTGAGAAQKSLFPTKERKAGTVIQTVSVTFLGICISSIRIVEYNSIHVSLSFTF